MLSAVTGSFVSPIAVGVGLVVVYNIALALYRLTLHPLAKFPGPKFAAVSGWYEFWYELNHRGDFLWHIRDLHDKYGPIIRLTPNEIHIRDPEFYDEVYAGPGQKREKSPAFAVMAGAPGSTFSAITHELHRQRRGVLNPFFLKRTIAKSESQITEKVSQLCRRFEEYSVSKEPLHLDAAISALTMDVISRYSFGENCNQVGDPNWNVEWKEVICGFGANCTMLRQFPWGVRILPTIPLPILKRLNGNAALFMRWKLAMDELVKGLVEKNAKGEKADGTIFQAILDSDLPPHEKLPQRLADEAIVVVSAGTETTARVLTVVTFFLYFQPAYLQKLRTELEGLISELSDSVGFSRNDPLPLSRLEQLPYLTACISEGLRFTAGLTGRLPRVSLEPLSYGDWVIPPHTPISLSHYFITYDPVIFPNPTEYNPDRWIKAAEAGKRLDKYLVSFSRGSRMCIGVNLAWAEMYLTLAHVIMKFDMQPYNTTVERDVCINKDYMVGMPKDESKGIYMLVTARG